MLRGPAQWGSGETPGRRQARAQWPAGWAVGKMEDLAAGHSPFPSRWGKWTRRASEGTAGQSWPAPGVSQLVAVENSLPQTLGHVTFKESKSLTHWRAYSQEHLSTCHLKFVKSVQWLLVGLSFGLVLLFETGSLCDPEWPQTHYVAKTDLDLVILLQPPPKCWDYKCVSHA